MLRAVQGLSLNPDHLLIDAMRIDHHCSQTKLIYGDSLSLSIAAASVVAKVHRDALMRGLDAIYPMYGLASHKGYGTPAHKRALAAHGPSEMHRQSFAPVTLALSWLQVKLTEDKEPYRPYESQAEGVADEIDVCSRASG